MVGKPLHCVHNASATSFDYPDLVATVGLFGWSNVPNFYRMGAPGSSVGGFLMAKDKGSGRGHWGSVVIKKTMDLCMG